jgi:hypothetical protein
MFLSDLARILIDALARDGSARSGGTSGGDFASFGPIGRYAMCAKSSKFLTFAVS